MGECQWVSRSDAHHLLLIDELFSMTRYRVSQPACLCGPGAAGSRFSGLFCRTASRVLLRGCCFAGATPRMELAFPMLSGLSTAFAVCGGLISVVFSSARTSLPWVG